MNILIAGYGNIGRSLKSLLDKHPISSIENIHIADISDGLEAVSEIKRMKDTLDIVVNVTSYDNVDIIQTCEKYGIHYIDTGFEETYKILDVLYSRSNQKSPIVKMWGFGMNPGLIEYMYLKHNISKNHIVIEFETDTGVHYDDIFNTWSPETYYTESVKETPFVIVNGIKQFITHNESDADVELFYDGKMHKYLWIPHEEIYTITNLNPLCKLCAFLYSAPQKLQEHLIQLRGKRLALENKIPVLHDIEGYDCVGLLIYDDSKNLTYIYNKADHQHCFKEYSCNGTSWQVACGIYVALTIMPFLDLGSYTFSNIPKSLFPIIDKTLDNLNFSIQKCENAIDEKEFKEKIINKFISF